MSTANSRVISLPYGARCRFSCEIDAGRIVDARPAPGPTPRFAEELDEALNRPLDFPPLEQAVISDDRVTVALDRGTPEAAALIAGVWSALARRGVAPENLTVIHPAAAGRDTPDDPRSSLPATVREAVRWKVHDPAAGGKSCRYLAATAAGERIYLASEIVDADVVLSVGPIGYDPVLGHHGTNSVFYPGLSSAETLARSRGQGQQELEPEDDRLLRQTVDEIGWLLGTQFTLQVIASSGGGAAHVLGGAVDSVFRRGKEVLAREWLVELDRRADLVVVAVDHDSAGHGWEQIGAAVSTARSLVARGGRIVVLSELDAEPQAGLKFLRECERPLEALKPLRLESPPDLIAATQVAQALDWADVYLLSRLSDELAEDLFFIPVASEREVARVLSNGQSDGTCLFLASAQHTWGRIRERG
ncbi:MAG TPA: lactate racemase domain-containing protein [Planctomycetaceae bacterium]|nr:lactate racemase domain-containing protein [Planctomycetaceae bacterium]